MDVAILPTNNFATIKVIIKLKIPWTSLSKVYLNIGTLCLLIKELTWAIIDSPEKEHKKLIILSFNGIVNVELAIILQPLVISILPRKSAYIESLGKLKNDSKLLKIMLILALFFIMPIIT